MSFGKRMARRKGERKSIGIARENSCKESRKRALFQASPNKYCAPDFIVTSRPAVPGFILFAATCSAEERNCPPGDLPPQGSADWPPSDGGLSTEIETISEAERRSLRLPGGKAVQRSWRAGPAGAYFG